ncbi:homeodomain-interacting protein kinase 1-like [Perca flavescens]|uniref:homeodomain-interacting protein kinase 1-like n=1 Tax=Perca flavescens TaxID=8167 RepID=UPI00106E5902|nr:homeodomain-interacting protein kinase 1-like [Perca flavescens]
MSPPYREREDFQVHENDTLSGKSCKYLVQNVMGEGSFGKVACCVKLDTMENVAVKIVKKHLTRAGKKEASAFKHICILDLNKSNLVTFLESFMHKGHMCLVLEILDTTLHNLMSERGRRPLCLSEIRVISQQMLVALGALGSIGLMHADIKPDNVMLVNHQLQPFRVKLIDFGSSTPVSRVKCGTTIQTLGYRAPEVILGLPLDEAVDMWSLGCVLAFLYLSKHLYPIRCEYDVMRVIVQMQGQPGDRLLDAGVHTKIFFNKNKDSTKQAWRLNTGSEYVLATGEKTRQSRTSFNKYTCMGDMTKDHEKPKTDGEHEDTRAFFSLLKWMLRLDPATRIGPAKALRHRFITMTHFPRDADPDPYVVSSRVNMTVLPPRDSPVEIYGCVGPCSSEGSHHGAASSSSRASAASADGTTTGKNAGPVPARPNEACGSDECTTCFVTVRSRRTAMLQRNRGFFLMMATCCCSVDVKE